MSGPRGGWPVMLADLALILFVTTAVQAAQSSAGNSEAAGAVQSAPPPPGIAQAYYVAEPGAPAFATWIAEQGQGAPTRVTIVSSYRPGEAGAALGRAQELVREAQAAGRSPRVLVEPGDGSTRAILAYDDVKS